MLHLRQCVEDQCCATSVTSHNVSGAALVLAQQACCSVEERRCCRIIVAAGLTHMLCVAYPRVQRYGEGSRPAYKPLVRSCRY